MISNLTAVFAIDEPDERHNLARKLARFSLLLLGADALTPRIIKRVWGENEVACHSLVDREVTLPSFVVDSFHLPV